MTPPNLSLLFVMVCFWATLWLVYRYLVRPVGAVVGERRRRIDDAQQEWAAKNEQYLAAVARVEEEVSQAARDAAKIRAAARETAMAERQASLDGARARADERLGEVLDTMAKEADEARQDLRRRAEELARLLAGRLLGRELAS
jgi:F0F1-type ATP synthase membrane subunit b/b'